MKRREFLKGFIAAPAVATAALKDESKERRANGSDAYALTSSNGTRWTMSVNGEQRLCTPSKVMVSSDGIVWTEIGGAA